MSQRGNIADRFARHRLIKGWDQNKISQAHILVAGAGAIGNETIKNLALLGIGRLTIVDMDKIEPSNLSRTVLFSEKDVGRSKAEVAAEKVRELSKETLPESFSGTLQEYYRNRIKQFKSFNLVLGCLDNMEARFFLNHIAVYHKIPYVDAGMISFEGAVQVVYPPFTPCLECNATPQFYRDMGRRYSCTTGDYVDLTEQQRTLTLPSFATTTSLISSIQVQEAVKIILGKELFIRYGVWPPEIGAPLDNLLQINGRALAMQHIRLEKNPDCYVCGARNRKSMASFFYKSTSITLSKGETLRSLKKRLKLKLKCRRLNLAQGLRFIPDYNLVFNELKRIQPKLIFISKSILLKLTKREFKKIKLDSFFVKIHRDLNQIVKSPLFRDLESSVKSAGKVQTLKRLTTLLLEVASKIGIMDSMDNEDAKLMLNTIEEVIKQVKSLIPVISEQLSIFELSSFLDKESYVIIPAKEKKVDEIFLLNLNSSKHV
jgi:molybdopterin/thiamine biosynthesis adenylyltransferase